MEIIKNFGIDPVFIVAQIVNFVIILFILRKLLYKPILDLLKKRQSTIKEGLEKTEEARIRLEKVVEEEKKILVRATNHAKKIVDDAKDHSLDLARDIEQKSKIHNEKMIEDAKERIRRDAAETEKKLVSGVSELAVKFLEKSLKKFFSEEEQKTVLQSALKKIKKND